LSGLQEVHVDSENCGSLFLSFWETQPKHGVTGKEGSQTKRKTVVYNLSVHILCIAIITLRRYVPVLFTIFKITFRASAKTWSNWKNGSQTKKKNSSKYNLSLLIVKSNRK